MLKLANNIFIVFLLAISLIFILTALGWIRLLVVKTGSMTPKVPVNSLIVVIPQKSFLNSQNSYKAGEVISFRPVGSKALITHRIASVTEKNGQTLYQTKGDANDGPDSILTAQKNVLGKMAFSFPYLGIFASFLNSFLGLFLIVVIPASLIILHEILIIQDEVKSMRMSKKTLAGPALIILFLLAATPVFGLFSSSVILEGNSLSTGEIVAIPLECSDITFAGPAIVGTGTGDKIDGTAGNDLIFGLGGGDLIDGKGGDDCIVGGSGGDSLNGGEGNDVILGEDESDYLSGGAGNDKLLGGDGSDGLSGGEGNDRLDGGAGSDSLKGGDNDDYLDGGSGSNSLNGESGTDTCLNGSSVAFCEIL